MSIDKLLKQGFPFPTADETKKTETLKGIIAIFMNNLELNILLLFK